MTQHRNTNSCPTCDRPIIDAGYVCHACTDQLRADLVTLARLWHQLDITLTRQDRIDDPGKTSVEPLPYAASASAAAPAISNVLTTWARHVMDERGTTLPPQTRPPRQHGPTCHYRHCAHDSCAAIAKPLAPDASTEVRCALWLHTQADWIRNRPEAEQIADEIADAALLLARTIDRLPPRRYVGPCDVCGADMYAHQWASEVTCPKGCDVTYNVTDRREWLLDKVGDRLAIAEHLARALTDLGEPIKSSRIRQWAKRGRLIPHGTDEAGRPVYRVEDVQHLLRDDERSRTKRPA